MKYGYLDARDCKKVQTFPYMGEFRWTSLAAMSNMALCYPIRIIMLVLNILPDNLSDTF
jgi:hypothetical protein